ncbi:MAG: DNA-processing protein DprA [Pseudomonadota bacterium]
MTIFNKNSVDLQLWLSVIRSRGVGAKTFWQLYSKDPLFGGVSTVDVEVEINQHAERGFSLCAGFDECYPEKLRSLIDAPPLFSYAGDVSLLQRPCIGIVGARNASPGGRRLAFEIANALGKSGFVIVSGMARGIDGAAHEGSLETGTIAVLAGGVDVIYPPEHNKLYDKLIGVGDGAEPKGCVISEMPLGTAPAAPLFPRRNRIIAALCDGLVVIEAAAKSGTLITAMHALELGRDVFVVPGSPLDPRSRGGNSLIKQGAILVESAEDILAHYVDNQPRLRKSLEEPKRAEPMGISVKSRKIIVKSGGGELEREKTKNAKTHLIEAIPHKGDWLGCLGLEPISIEEIMAQNTDLTTSALFSQLAELEMDGVIRRFPDGRIAKVFK